MVSGISSETVYWIDLQDGIRNGHVLGLSGRNCVYVAEPGCCFTHRKHKCDIYEVRNEAINSACQRIKKKIDKLFSCIEAEKEKIKVLKSKMQSDRKNDLPGEKDLPA